MIILRIFKLLIILFMCLLCYNMIVELLICNLKFGTALAAILFTFGGFLGCIQEIINIDLRKIYEYIRS